MQPLFCPSEFVADVYDTFGYHDIHQCIDEDENIVTDMATCMYGLYVFFYCTHVLLGKCGIHLYE